MADGLSYEQQKALDLRVAARAARKERKARMAEKLAKKRAECPHDGLPWSKEDDHILGLLIDSGRTREECAPILGRTATSVSVRANQLGIRFGRDHTIGSGYATAHGTTMIEARAVLVEQDERFQRLLQRAWDEKQFPGQK